MSQATCGDKDGGGAGTSAVTDADCGANYAYDLSKSASPCAGATCDAGGVDRVTCCSAVAYKYELLGDGGCTCDGVNVYNRDYVGTPLSVDEVKRRCDAHAFCSGFTWAGSAPTAGFDLIPSKGSFAHSGSCGYGPPTQSFGKSSYTGVRDFVCYKRKEESALCGDKDGPSGSGTSPVSDADCGDNYVYDPSKSAAKCVGATCDASGADKATCCVAQVRGCKCGVR